MSITEEGKNLISTCSSDDVVQVPIYSKAGEYKGTLITNKQFEHLLDRKWNLDQDGYAIRRGGKRFHRLVIGAEAGQIVDHINHNKLDNRIENLRIVTSQENARNRRKQTGVFQRKENGKWQAQIMVNYKNIRLGCYETYEEALQARLKAEQEYFGGAVIGS